MASGTGDGGKFFRLNVKKLGKESTRTGDLSCFKIPVIAFGTLPVAMLHNKL